MVGTVAILVQILQNLALKMFYFLLLQFFKIPGLKCDMLSHLTITII